MTQQDIANGASAFVDFMKDKGMNPVDAVTYMGCAISSIVCECFHGPERTEFVNDFVDCLWMAVRADHSGRGH